MSTNQLIKPYIVRYPMVSNQAGQQPDGNPAVYQAVWFAIKRRHLSITAEDRVWFEDTYADCMVEPGLTNRGSHKSADRETHDNPQALVYSSHITGSFKAAIEIYVYGKKNWWVYNNAKLTGLEIRKAAHGRMPGFIQNLKLALRKKLNLFDQIWWYLAVSFNRGGSGFQLAWLLVDLYKTQPYNYKILDKACRNFERDLSKRYPNLMGGVFDEYYGKEHLFAKMMQGKV